MSTPSKDSSTSSSTMYVSPSNSTLEPADLWCVWWWLGEGTRESSLPLSTIIKKHVTFLVGLGTWGCGLHRKSD
jgi:hypothetical protein